ncbi:hypothetical protein ILYODFUR_006320 [Ilyodon furcidens]|uniref:Uncharacterized protein n=1 Tax=Ilyodon furcidens TaxID=33524 RepID=A0ABV0VEU4_9TELE
MIYFCIYWVVARLVLDGLRHHAMGQLRKCETPVTVLKKKYRGISTAMASGTDGLKDADMKHTVEEDLVSLQQKEKVDVRLATLSENIDVCNAVLDDLKNKSLQDVYLKPLKETEEPHPEMSP